MKKKDSFRLITSKNPKAIEFVGVRFRFACCDCHLVHNITITSAKLQSGEPLELHIERNKRATNYRRKLKGKKL